MGRRQRDGSLMGTPRPLPLITSLFPASAALPRPRPDPGFGKRAPARFGLSAIVRRRRTTAEVRRLDAAFICGTRLPRRSPLRTKAGPAAPRRPARHSPQPNNQQQAANNGGPRRLPRPPAFDGRPRPPSRSEAETEALAKAENLQPSTFNLQPATAAQPPSSDLRLATPPRLFGL